MKYKLIFLTIILVLLSGCSAAYYLEIDESGSAFETVISKDYYKYYSEDDLDDVVPTFFSNESDITYYLDNDGNLVITRYESNYNELNNNKEINDYFGKVTINSKKISFKPNYDTCLFMFSDGGEYVTNDKIEINVILPFKVVKSNANKVVDNIYTWTYGIDDCKKEAYIKLKSSIAIYFIIGGILLIGLIAYFVIKIRKNHDVI